MVLVRSSIDARAHVTQSWCTPAALQHGEKGREWDGGSLALGETASGDLEFEVTVKHLQVAGEGKLKPESETTFRAAVHVVAGTSQEVQLVPE